MIAQTFCKRLNSTVKIKQRIRHVLDNPGKRVSQPCRSVLIGRAYVISSSGIVVVNIPVVNKEGADIIRTQIVFNFIKQF